MLIWFLTYDRISEACPPVGFNNEDRVCLLDNEYQYFFYSGSSQNLAACDFVASFCMGFDVNDSPCEFAASPHAILFRMSRPSYTYRTTSDDAIKRRTADKRFASDRAVSDHSGPILFGI